MPGTTAAPAEHLSRAVITPGLTICGMPPAVPLVTIDPRPCWNCDGTRVLRRFSGSAYYEDSFTCLDCGEDVGSGYRPFRRAWRKHAIARAELHLAHVIPRDEFMDLVSAAVREQLAPITEEAA